MPGLDGTGPLGLGPMTGRGRGFCVLAEDKEGRGISGYVGARGRPFRAVRLSARAAVRRLFRGGSPGRGFRRARRSTNRRPSTGESLVRYPLSDG